MQKNIDIVCFGSCQYDLSTGILRRNNLGTPGLLTELHLSHRMQLLLGYFIKNSGRLIFKEELFDLLFDGDKDKELPVLRTVSALRKLLGDDGNNPKYIVTIRKRGFRFVADVCFSDNDANLFCFVPELADQTRRPFDSPVSAIIFLVLTFLISAVVIFVICSNYFARHENNLPTKSVSLSSMPGAELEVNVSPDGTMVVYNHSVDMENNYKIIVQNLKSKEKWVIKSEDRYSLHGPVWGMSGNEILYQRLLKNEKCEIRKLHFDLSTYKEISDDLITNCGSFSFASKIQITPDHKFIFFSSRDDDSGQISVVRYSIQSNTSQKLTSPPASGLGDYSISIAPNGEKLAFLRGATQTHAQLWMMTLNDGTLDMLHESDDFFPTAITWSVDGKEILIAGNGKSIDVLDVGMKKFTSKIQTDHSVVYLAQTLQGDLIFSGGNFWDSSIWQSEYLTVENNQRRLKAIEFIAADKVIEVSPIENGPVAVISERTGDLSLWFYYPDGKQIEITGLPLKNEYAKGEFSPDGKRFLIQTGDDIWIIDDHKFRPLSFEKHKISAQFSWSADGRKVFYTASVYGTPQVYSLDLVNGTTDLIDQTLALYAESPNGKYAVRAKHRQNNLEITDSSGTSHFLPISGGFNILSKRFVLRNNAIYFRERHASGDYEIMRYDIQKRNLESTGIRQKLQGRLFAVSYDERFIFTDDGKKGDIDVRLLTRSEKK